MRRLLAFMAACLFGMASPASAALVQLSINGTLVGTQSTIVCGNGSPQSCVVNNPGGVQTQPYGTTFMQTLIPFDVKEGDNAFTFGSLSSIGLYSGTINYTNGVLTGRNLFYSFENPGVRSGTVGSSFINASAPTFAVAAVTAVPEPATWALMLLGFLAVGSALRQAPRRALLPA